MTAAAEIARPRLRVFAGPNGSGKSTIQELLKPEWIGVYINADDIEKQLGRTGTLDLGALGLVSAPEVLQQRLRAHLADSGLLRANGLEGVAAELMVDVGAALRLPSAQVNSYVSAVLADACSAANRAYVFDNSGEAHELIAEVDEGEELTVHSPALPAWFTQTTLWQSFQGDADTPLVPPARP